jgi:hypothetical protein
MKEMIPNDTGFWWRKFKERNHIENPGVNGRIILKFISKERNGKA